MSGRGVHGPPHERSTQASQGERHEGLESNSGTEPERRTNQNTHDTEISPIVLYTRVDKVKQANRDKNKAVMQIPCGILIRDEGGRVT